MGESLSPAAGDDPPFVLQINGQNPFEGPCVLRLCPKQESSLHEDSSSAGGKPTLCRLRSFGLLFLQRFSCFFRFPKGL